MLRYLAPMALLICAMSVQAEGGERSPGDLTVEERMAMMKSANDYNACVYKESLAVLKHDSDIRQVADLAMGLCQTGLDDLKAKITKWGFDDHFAEGFVRNVRSRAAHKLLPELAVKLGN